MKMSTLDTYNNISDRVGWQHQTVAYPTMTEVEQAVTSWDVESLLRWNRFLPVGGGPEKEAVWMAVANGLQKAKKERWGL